MTKDTVNKGSRPSGGVNTSSSACLGMLCYSELVSESKGIFNNIFKTTKKALAFTLAETLIVMGIIGVVAALTIPNLNSSTADKEKVAKVKKIYSNLNDSLGRAQAVYGPIDEWKTLDSNENAQVTRFGDRLTEFMKVSKNCGVTANQGCYPKSTKILQGSGWDINDSTANVYRFILADGTSVAITGSVIIADIDGPIKGQQKAGVDIFQFVVDNNTVFTEGHGSQIADLLNNLNKDSGGGIGLSAATWVINYDNMDYLKLTNKKCPNGTTPTEENPRCK